MKTNFFSVTFWFNVFNNHSELLKVLSNDLKEEYSSFNYISETNNLFAPLISAVNKKEMTSISCSKINLQYTMEMVDMNKFSLFKERVLHLFDLLKDNDVDIIHTALFINGEIEQEDALKYMTKNVLNKNLISDDLIDATIKLGKKQEDLFYKIITLLNKKRIKINESFDSFGNPIPLPLISWHSSYVEAELIEVSYEINDKYLFDFTKDYHTTEFYLNKMLYLLEQDLEIDIDNVIKKGEF